MNRKKHRIRNMHSEGKYTKSKQRKTADNINEKFR